MKKRFFFVLALNLILFFHSSSMEFYALGESTYEEFINDTFKHVKTYLSVIKEITNAKKETNTRSYKKNHVYMSSDENIYFWEQVIQSEE